MQSLVADARISVGSLRESLLSGPEALIQAALHAKDLSVALTSLGLVIPADIVSGLSRHFSLRHTSSISLGLEISHEIGVVLDELAKNGINIQAGQMERWQVWYDKLPDATPDQRLIEQFGDSSGLSGGDPNEGINSETLRLRRLSDGLRLLQEARDENFADRDRTVLTVDAILGELQDWLLKQTQYDFTDLFRPFQLSGGPCFVDRSVREHLRILDVLVRRARSVKVNSRLLNVYLDCTELLIRESEKKDVDKTMAVLNGRVEQSAGNTRFIFPSSELRARMTPFVSDGSEFAVFSAQVISYTPAAVPGGKGLMECVVGYQKYRIYVDLVKQSETMNIFDPPNIAPIEKMPKRLAINGKSDIFEVWFPH